MVELLFFSISQLPIPYFIYPGRIPIKFYIFIEFLLSLLFDCSLVRGSGERRVEHSAPAEGEGEVRVRVLIRNIKFDQYPT